MAIHAEYEIDVNRRHPVTLNVIRLITMRFTSKTLFTVTAFVALILGGLFAVERGYRPDPRSEVFEILGVYNSPSWVPCKPNENSSGLASTPISITNSYRGRHDHSVRQTLFSYSYNDKFGNPTFDIQYDLDANFVEDWSEHLFNPIVSGGGNTGANATIVTKIDVANREIAITIRQGFNSPAVSKECQLRFAWNGKSFQLRNGG